MRKYDYREVMCDDIRQVLNCRGICAVTADNRDEVYEELYDDLWTEDSVTGNASGSYTFNAWKAEENLCHNMDLLCDALEEFGYGSSCSIAEKGAEWCDVTIRCYLLSECLNAVLDELIESFEEELEKANEWWSNASDITKEVVTGYALIDFDDANLFYDEVADWWDFLADEDKVAEYQKHC